MKKEGFMMCIKDGWICVDIGLGWRGIPILGKHITK